MAGAFVLRVEARPMGAEGVILAAAGQVPGVNMIDTVFQHLEAMFKDCASIRYHTASPALARRLAGKGYAISELVCKKVLK